MSNSGIMGFGGHASVVSEACEALAWKIEAFFVEEGLVAASPEPKGRVYMTTRKEVLNPKKVGLSKIALGIGNNEARLWWCEKLLQDGFQLPPVVHPKAWVSPTATLAAGVFVGAGAVVQAGARIAQAALINSSATVEHHCEIGAGAHIGPGAVLAGLAKVGEKTMVGAGAVIRDRIKVGKNATVGAGAVVVQDVSEGLTVAGVPAKPIS
jgi:sugar O-acyltransferase (sialic acid O-acetyltransferase NeuD family)